MPLMINGKGPFNFVMDTGVGVCLITDPSLRDSLHLESQRVIKILGFGEGAELSADVCQPLEFRLNTTISGSISAAVLREDTFDLSSYAGMPVHGLMGYDFFNSFIVRINYPAKTLKVYKPETWYIPRKGHAIPIRIEGGKPFVNTEIKIDSGRVIDAKLIIDTGAGHPLWLESDLGQPIRVPQKNIRANLGVGLLGKIDGSMARIASFKLGKYTLENVVTAFPDFSDVGSKIAGQRTGNLGNAVLKKFDVVFDYDRSRMYLKPNFYFREPFEHNMSGIELVYRAPGFNHLIIARVEEGSAADEAGLLPQDEIVSIDLKPVRELELDDIYHLFRSKDGRGILLGVIPQGGKKPEYVLLSLKRRI